MKHATFKIGAFVIVVAALSLAGGYELALRHAKPGHQDQAGAATQHPARKVLYWYDPMKPEQHFDHPGKSPFMDMPLVPKYAEEGGGSQTEVRINPAMRQNLGVRYATVRRAVLPQSVEAAANVVFDDREVAILQARSNGFVEKVYGRAPGDVIARGAPIVDLLMPEWAGAQVEYLAMLKAGDKDLAAAARERLQLLGMPDDLIARVAHSGKTHPVITVATPIGGVIQTLEVRQGMTVTAGQTLARVNGIGKVWLEASVPEAQSSLARNGMTMAVRCTAWPGKVFKGKVIAILPQVSSDSRTVRVRIELPNPDGRLRPGMFAQIRLDTDTGKPVLLVPSEAVIHTGLRQIAILAKGHGRFEPVEVIAGLEAGDQTTILAGLSEGQKVVDSGQFLIDSEADLDGVLARMNGNAAGMKMNPPASQAVLNNGTGRVEAVSAGNITISHQPIPSIGWGAMTMTFVLAKPDLAASIKPGDRVSFGFRQDKDRYVIERLEKSGSGT